MPEQPQDNRFISLREAVEILEISESEIEHLVAQGTLPAYKLGEKVLRFRRDQVGDLKARWRINRDLFDEKPGAVPAEPVLVTRPSSWDRVADFFYFNDFYIFCGVLIAGLVYLIVVSQ